MGLFRRKPSRPARRRGILAMTFSAPNLPDQRLQVEVEEMERQGDLSRLRVIRVTGTHFPVRELIPAWVEQADIHWLTGGSA